MFSDVSDRTPRKVRITSETTAMTSLLETGCLPPLGSVVGCVADCVVGRFADGLATGCTGCYRLLASCCMSRKASVKVRTVVSHWSTVSPPSSWLRCARYSST